MNKHKLALASFRLKNFKAVRDSGLLKFTPLTVFIGNNGSGKSSVIEGLETYQTLVMNGLYEAMDAWSGYEHVLNKSVPHNLRYYPDAQEYHSNRIFFYCRGTDSYLKPFIVKSKINHTSNFDEVYIEREDGKIDNDLIIEREYDGSYRYKNREISTQERKLDDINFSVFKERLFDPIAKWQFLRLNPKEMGYPKPQKRTSGKVWLEKGGANIAQYLMSIRALSQSAFDGIIETLQFILPYAGDLQPTLTSELERNVYLQLTESDFKVPGWLLSTGTLRLVALLALLRHPTPPPLIVVEEIENGLDPRSIHLLVEEIRNAVLDGTTQVILTTHSPYLLDLLTLEHLVLVERDAKGQPRFFRPADNENLQRWATKFAPGKLYTMGNLAGSGS